MSEVRRRPSPGRQLGVAGRKVWNRVWRENELVEDVDADWVLMLCESIDEREQLRAYIATGEALAADRRCLRELDKQVLLLFKGLGMSPDDRRRLGAVLDSGGGLDDLAAFRARVAK